MAGYFLPKFSSAIARESVARPCPIHRNEQNERRNTFVFVPFEEPILGKIDDVCIGGALER